METKRFHLGDVLNITTGRLVSDSHIDGVYEVLNFMTGDDLYTHQLLRAMDECQPNITKQFPQLSSPAIDADIAELDNRMGDINDPTKLKEIVAAWLVEMVTKYGEFFEVEKMPIGSHEVKDPISELGEMVDPSKIVVVGKN